MKVNKAHCCGDCSNQVKIMKHPCNEKDFTKGSISERIAYGCALDCFDNNGKNRVVLMESQRGSCECWTPK